MFKSILDENGYITIPNNTLVMIQLTKSELTTYFPAKVIWETQSNEYGGRCFRYPVIANYFYDGGDFDITPEEFDESIMWCDYKDFESFIAHNYVDNKE